MLDKIVLLEMYIKEKLDTAYLEEKGFVQDNSVWRLVTNGLRVTYRIKYKELPILVVGADTNKMLICELPDVDTKDIVDKLTNLGFTNFEDLVLYGTDNSIIYELKDTGFINAKMEGKGFIGNTPNNVLEDVENDVVFSHQGNYWTLDIARKSNLKEFEEYLENKNKVLRLDENKKRIDTQVALDDLLNRVNRVSNEYEVDLEEIKNTIIKKINELN